MILKVLLVDDEVNIVRNLKKVIPWQKLGFASVQSVSNGLKALHEVEADEPDLILCDIRMPIMDGVSMLQKLREQGRQCEVVMLTGYQDFDYVRKSLKYGARDYVLKPINYEELEAVVGKLAVEIIARKTQTMHERNKWNNALNLAYEKFLFDVLLDYTSVGARQFLFDEGEKLDELEYTLLLVDLDDYSLNSRFWNEQERKLKNFAVRNVLQDALFGAELRYAALQMREGEWCVLVEHHGHDVPHSPDQLIQWSSQLQQAVQNNVKLHVSIGAWPARIPVSRLAGAYKKLQRTVHLSPNKQQIMLVEEKEEPNPINSSMWSLIEEIVSSVKQRERDKMEQAFEHLNRLLPAIAGQSVLHAEQLLHFLILHLLREFREIHLVSDEEEQAVWKVLERSISVKNLLDIIYKLIDNGMKAGTNRKPSEMLMLSAKDYMAKHLAADFGVEEIADYLGISCSYFSMLFKQHYGETFLESLTKMRIEQAKSLLLMSDKSITQIGKMVGYAERRYFTRVFLKFTGLTPSDYREKQADIRKESGPTIL